MVTLSVADFVPCTATTKNLLFFESQNVSLFIHRHLLMFLIVFHNLFTPWGAYTVYTSPNPSCSIKARRYRPIQHAERQDQSWINKSLNESQSPRRRATVYADSIHAIYDVDVLQYKSERHKTGNSADFCNELHQILIEFLCNFCNWMQLIKKKKKSYQIFIHSTALHFKP